MTFAIEYYSYFFFGFYLNVYILITILLLIGTLVLKNKYQAEAYNLLYVFNTIAAWSCLMMLFYFLGELFYAWYGQNPYEWYAFKTGGEKISWPLFYLEIIGIHFIGLLFFIRRLRVKRLFIILFILLLNMGVFKGVFYTLSDANKAPFWSLNFFEVYNQSILMYLMVILLIATLYVIAWKRNKLPYTSVFLK